MFETIHDGVRFRSIHSVPAWGPPLAVAYFRQMGGGPSRTMFADVIALDSLFPADWNKMQRRERLGRLIDARPELDGRFVMRVENRPSRHIYDKTKAVVVEAGTLPETLTQALREPRAPDWTEAPLTPLPVSAPSTGLADLERRLGILERAFWAMQAPAPGSPVTAAQTVVPPPAPVPVQPAAAAHPSYTPPAGAEPSPAYPKVPTGPRQPAFNVRDYMLSYNPKRAGRRLARAMVSYRVEELEENYSRICSILGLAPLARGCMVPEEFCFADCEARIARVLPRTAEFERAAGVPDEPCHFPEAYLGPAQTWQELAERSSKGAVPFSRITAQIRVRSYRHPELDIPIEPVVGLDDES